MNTQARSAFKSKKVLVTGASGLIGRSVIRALKRTGAEITAAVHKTPLEDKAVASVQADLTAAKDCERAVAGADIVIHCAAQSFGSGAPEERNRSLSRNMVMDALIIDAATRQKIERLQLVSSTTLYPEGDNLSEEQAFLQDPPPSYRGVGWAKRAAEKLAGHLCDQSGVKLSIVRPSSVYGPHDSFDPKRSNVLPALIRRAVAREDPFQVWGDGKAERDFVFVDDVAEGMLAALAAADGRAFNLGAGKTTSIRDAAAAVLEAAEHPVTAQFGSSQPSSALKRSINVSAARETLGWSARTGLKEGLQKTVSWYRDNL